MNKLPRVGEEEKKKRWRVQRGKWSEVEVGQLARVVSGLAEAEARVL